MNRIYTVFWEGGLIINIGNALKYYRKLSKLTQVQVADMAGVNDKYYGEIERGESSPTLERLELISYSLGVDIQQLVGYKQLVPVVIEVQASQEKATNNKKVHAYCNCCGIEFISNENDIKCPQCECEYSDENEYIEIYGH